MRHVCSGRKTDGLFAFKRKTGEEFAKQNLAISKWGGVAQKQTDRSRLWVTKATGPDLIARITRAVELLKGADDPTQCFDGEKLLMNSAVTKVYAFADSTRWLAIYDGRVGAALMCMEASAVNRFAPASLR